MSLRHHHPKPGNYHNIQNLLLIEFWLQCLQQVWEFHIFVLGTMAPSEQNWNGSDDQNFLDPGVVTLPQILNLKVFRFNYSGYIPNSDAVRNIRKFSHLVEIKVFFGDWCKDSKKMVPAFIKIIESTRNPNIAVTYINLSRDKTQPSDLLSGWNVTSIPIFAVLHDGKEAGRIVETPEGTLEEDLWNILKAL